MDIHLTSDLEELVQRKVQNGYGSADDVVREALRMLDERDQMLMLRKEQIRKQIAEGIESLRRGEGVDGEIFFDELLAGIDNVEKA